ncbi:YlbE-like family protein [Heyndrickxia acidiproducens]|uniref:YlbE-like family protein n=1 Tax=Heyndrickxia acidiproducens TaxID=1121084 RepID=UPI0003792D40|nr:YlbE-like family protein [Heyndrickxia acidiproducens]
MRADLIEYISQSTELRDFLRAQPIWYRKLSRHPEEIEQFQIASLHYYQKTIPHRVEKFTTGLQMAQMMMHMIQSMYEN